MPADLILPLIMRWLHIFSAIIAIGGVFFLILALRPALRSSLPTEQQSAFRDAVMKRFRLLFHPLILVFLITGFYNYLVVTRLNHEEQPLYHMLFGIKFLLALVVFGLTILVTSGRPWSARLRENQAIWMLLALAAVAVVLVAGWMKMMPQAG